MHIFFSGIGGVGIGPLSLIAHKLGYHVSGSDLKSSAYTDKLHKAGIEVSIGQNEQDIKELHQRQPIDWFVYSSALPMQNPNHPELQFIKGQTIRASKRDEFLSYILNEQDIKMLAVAGTHGKTTTTAMCVWLFKQLNLPFGYSVGGKIPFGEMGDIQTRSEWFVYEADEFDRNFLSFEPSLSAITGIAYDHHEIYPTEDDYNGAFVDFIRQSQQAVIWQQDADRIYKSPPKSAVRVLSHVHDDITLVGAVNRQNATLAVHSVSRATGAKIDDLIESVNQFPGVSRRFETIVPNLISDYAHTPEKITGALQTARELKQNIVVIHEPLTNQRQYFVREEYAELFRYVKKLYWVPSYLAREPADLEILTPAELIKNMNNPEIAEPADLSSDLKYKIDEHLAAGDLVLALSGGGADSLDSWLRQNYTLPS